MTREPAAVPPDQAERGRDGAPARPVSSFTPSDFALTFDASLAGFVHSYDRDLQLFVVWERARSHEDEIIAIIEEKFRVLAEFEVVWSPDRVIENFERLYSDPLTGSSTKHRGVGSGPFLLIVAEDPEPLYRYRQNVSGYVELTNVHVSDAKRAARKLAGGYTVHSSNNMREFFRDAVLLLGPDLLDETVTAESMNGRRPRQTVARDLMGADGWSDLAELLAVLHRASEYVVLRNYEGLPGELDHDPEIDLLTRDRLDFVAITNARGDLDETSGAAFTTTVGDREIVLDVRFVGDGYLDGAWQSEMLSRRTWTPGGLAVPRADDYFFSLLYHAKVQKPDVKPVYVPRLEELGSVLGLSDTVSTRATQDDVALSLLDGFLGGHAYGVPRAIDRGVYRNDAFVEQLRLARVERSALQSARTELWDNARHSRLGRRAARFSPLRTAVRGARSTLRTLMEKVRR